MRMAWTLVFPQSFPLGLRMPSSLRVLLISREYHVTPSKYGIGPLAP